MTIDIATWLAGVIADRRIGYIGKQVAEVLARSFADGAGACQLSGDRIADEMSTVAVIDAGSVRCAIAHLETAGWLEVKRPPDANRRGRGGLRYRATMSA